MIQEHLPYQPRIFCRSTRLLTSHLLLQAVKSLRDPAILSGRGQEFFPATGPERSAFVESLQLPAVQ